MGSRLARGLLHLAGWRIEFDGLPGSRGILIVYPHTSNWDFIIGLLAKWSIGLPIRWVGKEALFRGVAGTLLGPVLRAWGGRPVDRRRPSGAVEQLARLMASESWFWLALSPEGTRRRTDHLRSGFYHLALKTGVPVGLAYIDYRQRRIGVREFIRMTGNVDTDLQRLREVYADKAGRHPRRAGEIALRATRLQIDGTDR